MHEHHPEADSIGQALVKQGVKLVVFGAHAANVYKLRPRTTQDVDFLCDDLNQAAAIAAAQSPDLVIEDQHQNMIRVSLEGREIADFVEPVGPVLSRVFKETSASATNPRRAGLLLPAR